MSGKRPKRSDLPHVNFMCFCCIARNTIASCLSLRGADKTAGGEMEEGGFNRYSIMSGTPLFLLTAMRLHLTSCWGGGGLGGMVFMCISEKNGCTFIS